jgi:CBS domain containing-hemolysin-like protein
MRYSKNAMSDIPEKTNSPSPTSLVGRPVPANTDIGDPLARSSRPEGERKTLFQRLSQLFRGKASADFRDDLADALAEDDTDGSGFSAGEREMLNNILGFREISVEDLMIPRADVIGVDMDTSLATLLELFESSGHSRMPVYSGDLDDPRGMVHIRDVLGHITRTARTKKLSRAKPGSAASKKAAENTVLDLSKVDLTKSIGELKLLREVLFVPHSMLAGDLLQRMRATRTQMALVIDEYGGTDGLCSMEDVVEMVVGDIEDEHDDADSSIVEQSPGVYVVDGGVELEDLAEAIGPDFVVGKDGEDVDTIAGLIIAVLGHHPVKGETCVAVPGFDFKVVEAGNRRIRKVRISRTVE